MKFENGEHMYNYICDGVDLYSKSLNAYVFVYNDAGALCLYNLCPEDVIRIIEENKEARDYWAGYLGWRGSAILDESDYDDDEHRYSDDWELNKLYLKPSLDFCEETYMVEDWMDTRDVTVEYVLSE